MSSAVPTKSEKPVNTLPSRAGLLAWYTPLLSSTVGRKFLVALTGLILTSFVIAHMVGNLQIFQGPARLNAYAKMLKDLGPILWAMRGVLLAALVVHMYCSLSLKRKSLEARPVGYFVNSTARASIASRTMVLTGLTIFAFLLFHLAHYTFGWIGRAPNGQNFLDLRDASDPARSEWHDVYAMTVYGFRNPVVSVLYLIAQAFLFMHLQHGVGSAFQTLGLCTPRLHTFFKYMAWTVATVVVGGNLTIVLAVWLGFVGA